MPLRDMYEHCGQCGFIYARVDTEGWGKSSARRIMCPVCGWTVYEEISWESDEPEVVKRDIAKGFGAFRLLPPGGYCGYNAFHERPSIEVLKSLVELLSVKGWKGYISLWNDDTQKATLVHGSPLSKFALLKQKLTEEKHHEPHCDNRTDHEGNQDQAVAGG